MVGANVSPRNRPFSIGGLFIYSFIRGGRIQDFAGGGAQWELPF